MNGTTQEARFAPVSVVKFVVLSLCSFGIYQVALVYRQFRHERDQGGAQLSPFWRTFLAPIWLYDLLRRIARTAEEAGVRPSWNAVAVTVVTVILWLTSLLRQPWGLISMFAFVPSIPVQLTVNAINARLSPDAPRNDRFTPANIVLVVVGGLLLALVIWSLFVMPLEIGQGTLDAQEAF